MKKRKWENFVFKSSMLGIFLLDWFVQRWLKLKVLEYQSTLKNKICYVLLIFFFCNKDWKMRKFRFWGDYAGNFSISSISFGEDLNWRLWHVWMWKFSISFWFYFLVKDWKMRKFHFWDHFSAIFSFVSIVFEDG